MQKPGPRTATGLYSSFYSYFSGFAKIVGHGRQQLRDRVIGHFSYVQAVHDEVSAELMNRIEKTVFLSYRRTNAAWAIAIYKSLSHHGYDVFLDFTGIENGDFEKVILGNIRARAHFLALLTPSALKRCHETGDRLRREIEAAMKFGRNVVPLFLDGFDFETPTIGCELTGTLAALRDHEAFHLAADHFEESMYRLRTRALRKPVDAELCRATAAATRAAKAQQAAAAAARQATTKELTAQVRIENELADSESSRGSVSYSEQADLEPYGAVDFYNRGNERGKRGDLAGAIEDFTEAIRLDPEDGHAFNNRGSARQKQGDLDGALADYSQAIRCDPDDAIAFRNRGMLRELKGGPKGALEDYEEAIRLKPDYADAYYCRGNLRKDSGDPDGAIEDFSRALELKPEDPEVLWARGVAHAEMGDLDGAIWDYSAAICLEPDYFGAFYSRVKPPSTMVTRTEPWRI